MRRTSESGSSTPCAATITLALPKNDHASAHATRPIMARTTAASAREGSAVRIAMPSLLWSASASFRGLRRFACVIARVSKKCQLAFQEFRIEHVAQLAQGVALQLRLGLDLVADRGRFVRRRGAQLRVHLHGLLRGAARIRQQAGPGAERARDDALAALRSFDGALVAIVLPQRARPVHAVLRPREHLVLLLLEVGLRGARKVDVFLGIEREAERQQLLRVA